MLHQRLADGTARKRSVEDSSDEKNCAQHSHDDGETMQAVVGRMLTVDEPKKTGRSDRTDISRRTLQARGSADLSRRRLDDLRSPTSAANVLAEEIATFGEGLAAKGISAREPVQFRMVVEGLPRALSSNVYVDIFRIAREALRNSFSHSQGHLIEAELAYTDSLFRLRIRDDGKGIDPDERVRAERTGHWGLKGMRERTEHLSGELEVWSEPGAGTEIELRVPASIAYETVISLRSSWLFWRRKRDH